MFAPVRPTEFFFWFSSCCHRTMTTREAIQFLTFPVYIPDLFFFNFSNIARTIEDIYGTHTKIRKNNKLIIINKKRVFQNKVHNFKSI